MNGSICRRKAGLIRFKGPALYAPVLLAHFGRRGIFLLWFSLYKLGETSSPRCVKQLNLLLGDTSGFPVKPSPFRPGRSPSYGEAPRRFRLGALAYLGCIFTGIEPIKMQRGFPPSDDVSPFWKSSSTPFAAGSFTGSAETFFWRS